MGATNKILAKRVGSSPDFGPYLQSGSITLGHRKRRRS